MRLLVARHAPVSTKGLCYGQSDVPVSVDDQTAGELLVAQLAQRSIPIRRIGSSPWKRARGPAEHVAASLGLPLIVDARLSELAFGAWEGRPYAELEGDAAFRAWMEDWTRAAPPGGERLDALLARVRQWRAEVLATGQDTLAITHAGVIRALRAEARRVPYTEVVGEPVEALRVEDALR